MHVAINTKEVTDEENECAKNNNRSEGNQKKSQFKVNLRFWDTDVDTIVLSFVLFPILRTVPFR